MDTALSLVIAMVSYVLGIVTGYVFRNVTEKQKVSIQANQIVLVIVTAVWAMSMVVDIASPTYETSPLVHGLMGAIVGFFYRPGGSFTRKDDK